MSTRVIDEEVSKWLNRANRALAITKKAHEKQQKLYDMYSGSGNVLERDDDIYVHLMLPMLQLLHAALTLSPTEIIAKPGNSDSIKPARLMAQMLRHFYEDKEWEQLLDDVVFDCLLSHFSVVKIGYTKLFDNARARVEDVGMPQSVVDALNNITKKVEGEEFTDASSYADILFNEYVTPESVWISRVCPRNFSWDPSSPYFRDAAWCVERIIMPYPQLKRIAFYDTKGLESTHNVASILDSNEAGTKPLVEAELRGGRSASSDPMDDICIVYEIHNRAARQLIVVAEGHDKFLYKGLHPLPLNGGFAYDVLQLFPLPDRHTGMIPADLIVDQQEEKNRVRNAFHRHTKRFNRKYQANKTWLTTEGIEALKSEEDGVVVWTQDVPPGAEAITPVRDANVPADWYQVEDKIDRSAQMSLGVDEAMMGVNRRQLATQAVIQRGMSGMRLGPHVKRLQAFKRSIIRKVAFIIQHNLDREVMFKITGDADVQLFGSQYAVASKKDLQGNYVISIKTIEGVPMSKEIKQRNALLASKEIVMLAGQNPKFNPYKLARYIAQLHDMDEIDDILPPDGELLQPAPQAPPGNGTAPSGGLIDSLIGATAPVVGKVFGSPAAAEETTREGRAYGTPRDTMQQPGMDVEAIAKNIGMG